MNTTDTPPKPAGGVWKALLILILVFILGAATGIGGGLLILRAQIRKAATATVSQQGPLDKLAARVEAHLGDRLHLSATERSALHEELGVTTRRAKELRLRLADDIRALAGDTIRRIGARLPAEKQAALRKEMDERLTPWGLKPDTVGDRPPKAD